MKQFCFKNLVEIKDKKEKYLFQNYTTFLDCTHLAKFKKRLYLKVNKLNISVKLLINYKLNIIFKGIPLFRLLATIILNYLYETVII